jgi:hypothetical protein
MKPRNWIARPIAIAITLMVFAALLPTGAQAATRPHYDMQATLSFSQAAMDVVQKTTFRNNTGADLPDLVFQVTPGSNAARISALITGQRNDGDTMDGIRWMA